MNLKTSIANALDLLQAVLKKRGAQPASMKILLYVWTGFQDYWIDTKNVILEKTKSKYKKMDLIQFFYILGTLFSFFYHHSSTKQWEKPNNYLK